MEPGGVPLPQAKWALRVQAWFPERTDPRARLCAHGQIDSFHDHIKKHIGETSLATIHQRLRDEHGLSVSIASRRRYVRSELAEESARSAPRCCAKISRRAPRRSSTTGTSAGGSTTKAAPCAGSAGSDRRGTATRVQGVTATLYCLPEGRGGERRLRAGQQHRGQADHRLKEDERPGEDASVEVTPLTDPAYRDQLPAPQRSAGAPTATPSAWRGGCRPWGRPTTLGVSR